LFFFYKTLRGVGGPTATAAPRLTSARVYLTQLEVSLAAVELFLMDRPPGSLSILNAAPYQAAAIPLLTKADVVVVNETELAGYCNATVPRTSQEASAMARSLRRNRQTIIVTLGAHGSVTVGADEKVQTGFPAKVVDTTGAGDCFCGYLAARLAQGAPMWNATETAHRAAALSVASSGAMMSFPRLAELI
jgi:ribokinase